MSMCENQLYPPAANPTRLGCWDGLQIFSTAMMPQSELLSTTSMCGGFPKLGVPTIMEKQMEKKMENEMETGVYGGFYQIHQSATVQPLGEGMFHV